MDAGTKTLPCHERQASLPCPNRFGSTDCILSNHSYVPGSSSTIKHGKLRPVKLSIMSLRASRCVALGMKVGLTEIMMGLDRRVLFWTASSQ